jgi:hypothetical protein
METDSVLCRHSQDHDVEVRDLAGKVMTGTSGRLAALGDPSVPSMAPVDDAFCTSAACRPML